MRIFSSIVAVLILGAFPLALHIWRRCDPYFSSRDSFREFHGAVSRAVAVAQRKQQDGPPSLDDGTGFVTSSGLAVGVTCSNEGAGTQTLHVSLSQVGHVTTHALCSRLGFFVVAMLGDMQGELTPFYTDSGVHHLVFRFQAPTLRLQDFDSSYARYSTDYKPIQFRHEKMKSEPLHRTVAGGSASGAPGIPGAGFATSVHFRRRSISRIVSPHRAP